MFIRSVYAYDFPLYLSCYYNLKGMDVKISFIIPSAAQLIKCTLHMFTILLKLYTDSQYQTSKKLCT
jgi:hypothetical protein